MKLSKEEFLYKMKEAANVIGVNLNEKHLQLLYEYMVEVQVANEVMNLTAITDDEEFIVKHYIDSLYLIKEIDEYVNITGCKPKIIDVGTGAGFPGAVISIYYGDSVQITLLDALTKRTDFLERTKNKLGLKYSVVNSRSEEYARGEGRSKYDIVLTRAVARLNVLAELTVPLLKIGGKAMYMKASDVEKEIIESDNAFKVLGTTKASINNYYLCFDSENFSRNIVIIEKKNNTLNTYPRHFSKIKKQPL